MQSNTCYITKSLIVHGNTFFTRLTKILAIQCPYFNTHCFCLNEGLVTLWANILLMFHKKTKMKVMQYFEKPYYTRVTTYFF